MSSARSALEALHHCSEFRIAMLDRLRMRVFEWFFGRNARQPAPMRQLLVIGELQAHDQGNAFVNSLLWLFRPLRRFLPLLAFLRFFAGTFPAASPCRFFGRITAGNFRVSGSASEAVPLLGLSATGIFVVILSGSRRSNFAHLAFLFEAEGLLPAVDGAPRLLRRFFIRAEIENQIRLGHAIGISAAYIGVKSPPALFAQQSGTIASGRRLIRGRRVDSGGALGKNGFKIPFPMTQEGSPRCWPCSHCWRRLLLDQPRPLLRARPTAAMGRYVRCTIKRAGATRARTRWLLYFSPAQPMTCSTPHHSYSFV